MRVLWLTNDLPPRAGGIQQFVQNLLLRSWPDRTLVVGPHHVDATGFDADQPYRVVRLDGAVLPTPATLARVRAEAAAHAPDVVVLGAAWPLGELGPALRRDPAVPVVALSHGLEAGLAGAGLGRLVRRATRDLAVVTAITAFTESRLAPHVSGARLVRLPPGVDPDVFHPGVDGSPLRAAWGVPADAPLVGCVSRLVRRKGQDVLLDVWPRIAREVPDAWLALVGTGPLEATLRARAAGMERVVVPGGVAWDDLPRAHAALDVFAMPCRTRLAGTDVEGLGIVYLEAQSSGVPVIAGRSGGAPEAVLDGETGRVVDGRDRDDLTDAVVGLLRDPARARTMGAAGRRWVEGTWAWDVIATRFRTLLEETAT
jgi:phosphatidyl-myo-inositol dimannoside synthase